MNAHGSKWIRRERRLAIYMRDAFRCAYCRRDLRNAPSREVTLDHLVTRAAGGSNLTDNLVTACLACNSSRSDTPLAQYAPPTTLVRIAALVAQPLNMDLARSIIAGRGQPIEEE